MAEKTIVLVMDHDVVTKGGKKRFQQGRKMAYYLDNKAAGMIYLPGNFEGDRIFLTVSTKAPAELSKKKLPKPENDD